MKKSKFLVLLGIVFIVLFSSGVTAIKQSNVDINKYCLHTQVDDDIDVKAFSDIGVFKVNCYKIVPVINITPIKNNIFIPKVNNHRFSMTYCYYNRITGKADDCYKEGVKYVSIYKVLPRNINGQTPIVNYYMDKCKTWSCVIDNLK